VTSADCQREQSIKRVDELTYSQEGKPGLGLASLRKIENLTGISPNGNYGIKCFEARRCTCHLILIATKCRRTLLCRRFYREDLVFWW